MLILDENNRVLDTHKIDKSCRFSVLRLKDPKNPDFFFEKLDVIEEFTSHTMQVKVGQFDLYVPFHWSILCMDNEYVQTMPLYEFNGRDFTAFCLNPIDGFMPYNLPVRLEDVYPPSTWSAPPINDKDLLCVPIGTPREAKHKGPLCVYLSPHKLDISKHIADII